MAATQYTRLARKWWLKFAVFSAFFLFFGVYGLYDALHAYPMRGREDAEFKQWKYLEAARDNGQLSAAANITDPRADFERLREQGRESLRGAELAKFEWLASLRLVGDLEPEKTSIPSPSERLEELTQKWTGKNAPKPLSFYDIPVQWVFVFVGFPVGFWIIVVMLLSKATVYGWDPAEKRLYLPKQSGKGGGATLVPGDIEEFDKRQWHRFFLFVKVKASHPQLGGRELKLDMLKFEPLEAWMLEMEKIAFPENQQDSAATGSTAGAAAT